VILNHRTGRLGTATQLDVFTLEQRRTHATLRHWLVQLPDAQRRPRCDSWLACVVHTEPTPAGTSLGILDPTAETHQFALMGFRQELGPWTPELAVQELGRLGVRCLVVRPQGVHAVKIAFGPCQDDQAVAAGEELIARLLQGQLSPSYRPGGLEEWERAVGQLEFVVRQHGADAVASLSPR
jgi:hypothetical protein